MCKKEYKIRLLLGFFQREKNVNPRMIFCEMLLFFTIVNKLIYSEDMSSRQRLVKYAEVA